MRVRIGRPARARRALTGVCRRDKPDNGHSRPRPGPQESATLPASSRAKYLGGGPQGRGQSPLSRRAQTSSAMARDSTFGSALPPETVQITASPSISPPRNSAAASATTPPGSATIFR